MKTNILWTVLFCCAAAGFVAWRVHSVKTQNTPHFAIVEDRSISHPDGCNSLLGLAEQVFRTEGVTANSTLTVLVVGDESTANEPWQLGRYSIPRTRKVLEGRAADRRRQSEILRDIKNKCQAIRRTKVSPIFLGTKQAIADLRAQGCRENSRCALFVDSDLEENVEPSIKKSLDNRSGRTLELPTPINNQGFDTTFCGLAVTTDHLVDPSGRETRKAPPLRDSGREDRLRHVWLTLFTRPDAVQFQPYCPQKPSNSATATASNVQSGSAKPPRSVTYRSRGYLTSYRVLCYHFL